jgi:glycine/D-amino acid oxidase-like deaminating enzyme
VIAEGVPVARVEHDWSRPAAHLADVRTFAGELLVVAAGAWSRELVPELRELITVKRAGVASVSGLPAAFDAGTLPPFSVVDGNFYGFPRWRTERVKLGWHDGAEPVADPDFDRTEATGRFRMAVESFLEEHLGVAASSVAIEYASCAYDVSPASDFLVDAVPGVPGLFVVTGSSGHGFKFGSVIGRIALDRLDGVTDSPWWLPQFGWDHARRGVGAAEAATPI